MDESLQKRRCRDVLGSRVHEERYAANTLNTLECRQRIFESTPEDIRRQSRNNSKKIQDYWDTCQNESTSRSISSSFGNRNEKLDYSNIEGFYEKRRDAIYVLFRLMGSPEEEYWEDEGIVSNIMCRLMINPNSRSAVKSVLKNVLASDSNGSKFDSLAGCRKRGRTMLIEEFDDSARSLYNSFASGMGVPAAADILNLRRQTKKLEAISFGAISHFCKTSTIIVRSIRKTIKSGKKDASTDWAKARVVECDQILKSLGDLIETPEEIAANSIPRMDLHGIVFWDEKHKEQVNTCITSS